MVSLPTSIEEITLSSASEQTSQRSRIPTFRSVQEEAEFWDTHDSTEFEDEWEPVELEVAPNWRSVRLFNVELEYSLYKQLRSQAEAQGQTAEELAASWLKARLTDAPTPNTTGGATGAHTDQKRDSAS